MQRYSLICTDSLPSYREATEAGDWVRLISPYFKFKNYHSLCLVNRHFNLIFSPLLWNDLLKAVRLSGLDPGDDLKWWIHFVYTKLDRLSPSSRALIRILDARQFGKDAYESLSDQQDTSLNNAFKRALALLPNVNAILLDGHRDLDLGFLIRHHECQRFSNLRVLSLSECRYQIPRLFFATPSLQNVVFLDISYLPGSLLSVVQSTALPSLRILKARGRELQNNQCFELINHFGRQLWSLDISENNITDSAIQLMRDCCIPSRPAYTQANSFIQGKIVSGDGGSELYGPFLFMEDGELSGSFSHPERYYVDAPQYTTQSTSAEQDYPQSRSEGSSMIRQDTAEAAIEILAWKDIQAQDQVYQQSVGLTHLRLSHNAISAVGIQKLLHISDGQIEDLACDSLPFLPTVGEYVKFWPPHINLHGIIGAAHCFRPAMSRNLRVLRVHHSVVTNIPTLHMHGASYKARCLQAETIIRERIETMFPQAFCPDMNPRLYSLTLTCLPRFSSGPLISKLVRFLTLLSAQERAIQDISRTESTRRSPKLFRGLRHLRLVFDSNHIMEDGSSVSFSLDAESGGDEIFSFFDKEQVKYKPLSARPSTSPVDVELLTSEGDLGGESRLSSSSSSSYTTGNSCWSKREKSHFVTHDGCWKGKAFSVQVWVGPANHDAPEALRDYRRLVVEHGVRDGVGPVTPAQIQAGAPRDSYIYQIAWSAAVMPAALEIPGRDELSGMRDVLGALKTCRLQSRAKYELIRQLSKTQRGGDVLLGEPHFFWTGVLEVSTEVDVPVSSGRLGDWR
ncbi:hypothetical protein E4U21_004314 [Claviceps maximensis]|nr:hypothetical protein E4U21_004314 [Claviceps maximensis]